MMFEQEKNMTIVAPMTPAGVSAIAALRVSGSFAKRIAETLFEQKNITPRKACYGILKHPNTKKNIDSLLYIFFNGPSSFTGEDTLELFPHGNPLIVREILQAILQFPKVRLAEPGEFTKRAFLNGKLDLVQAASVGDMIHSTSMAALENAKRLLSGQFSKHVQELAKSVLSFSALLELDVDFAEEEADPDFAGWENRLIEIKEKISVLHSRFKNAAAVNRLPLAVVYGAPNAGKSSLINALLEEERLLVSNVAGTTRDFVEVRLVLPGGEIRLVDTAGIGNAPVSELDALSMEKSKAILAEADLKIHLVDPAEGKVNASENELLVYSKSDVLKIENELCVSSKTREGLDELRNLLNEKLYAEKELPAEDFWITSERERLCLEEALGGVERALELLQTNPAVELLAFEIQIVRRALLSITGEISSEDVLQSIFSDFCIGK
jgi:tRNA modification GTPase